MPTMNGMGSSRTLRSRTNEPLNESASSTGLKKPGFSARPPPAQGSTSGSHGNTGTPNRNNAIMYSPPRTRGAGGSRNRSGTGKTPNNRVVNITSPSRPLRSSKRGLEEEDEEEAEEFMNCDDLELDLSVYDKVEYHLCQGLSEEWGQSYKKVITIPKRLPEKCKWNPTEKQRWFQEKLDRSRKVIQDFVARRDNLLKSAQELDQAAARQVQDLRKRSQTLREREASLEKEKHSLEGKIDNLSEKVRELTTAKADLEDMLEKERNARTETATKLECEEAEKQDAEEQLQEAKKNISNLNSQISDMERKIKHLTDEKDSAVDQLANVQNEQSEKLRSERKAMDDRLQQMTEEHNKNVAELRQQVEQLQSELNEKKSKLAESESQLSDYQNKVREYENEVSRVTHEKNTAEQSKSELQKEVTDLREQIQQRDNHVSSAMASITKMQETTYAREQQLQEQNTKLNTRLQELQNERDELKSSETKLLGDLREKETNIKELSGELEKVKQSLSETQSYLTSQQSELADVKKKLEERDEEVSSLKKKIEQDSYEYEEKIGHFRYRAEEAEKRVKELEKHEKELKETKEDIEKEKNEAKQEAKEYKDKTGALEAELHAVKESLGATKEAQMEKLCEVTREADNLRRKVSTMSELHEKLDAAEERAQKLEQDLFEGEMQRRKLHNYVQDLRGNIRVCVRVRPFLQQDASSEAALEDLTPAVDCSVDGNSLTLLEVPTRGCKEKISEKEGSTMDFSFDNVFSPEATQKDVFNEVSELVQSALDGFNVCLFSYGQTGSGKTYTMQGSGSGEEAGLIPQSVLQILETIRKLRRQGWNYTLEASFLEIYNENLRDLLSDDPNGSTTLSIIHQEDRTDVLGLEKIPISTASEVRDLLHKAARNRSTGRTNMNELSSRSHSVFTLYLRGEHEQKGICVNGNLNLCDLAGSERLDRSGAEGQRLKETQNINKSLSCLADVFTSLAKNSQHVPFRNSKLTYLLQPCFKGNGKTMMLVNVSPTVASASETLCSLRFASQVSQVHLGQAKKRIASTVVPGTEDHNQNDAKTKTTSSSVASKSRKYATIGSSKPTTPRNSLKTPGKRGLSKKGSASLTKPTMSTQPKTPSSVKRQRT
eukprot:gb/GECG01002557.1/.p1 GENE.gb/GECG01002557.1/~~gb/GECG01002557.1/.p1  ORF type:complete len:1118 (+),score=210.17 gb/GECG01002557.1/:1-3354(+)